ncbi:hypothetical protein D3C84_365850 [compost metagenome]
MTKLFKFQENEEVCTCPVCRVLGAESEEDLESILYGLLNKAHTDGYKDGYNDALITDIETKQEILASINEECDCCEECCDEVCEF